VPALEACVCLTPKSPTGDYCNILTPVRNAVPVLLQKQACIRRFYNRYRDPLTRVLLTRVAVLHLLQTKSVLSYLTAIQLAVV